MRNKDTAHRNAEFWLVKSNSYLETHPSFTLYPVYQTSRGWSWLDDPRYPGFPILPSGAKFGRVWTSLIYTCLQQILAQNSNRLFWGSDSLTSKTTIWGGLPNQPAGVKGREKKIAQISDSLFLGSCRWLKKVKFLVLESLSAVEIQMQHATINELQGILAHELQVL